MSKGISTDVLILHVRQSGSMGMTVLAMWKHINVPNVALFKEGDTLVRDLRECITTLSRMVKHAIFYFRKLKTLISTLISPESTVLKA